MGNEAKLMISLGTGLFAGWLAKELTKNYGAKKSKKIGTIVGCLATAAMLKQAFSKREERTARGNDLWFQIGKNMGEEGEVPWKNNLFDVSLLKPGYLRCFKIAIAELRKTNRGNFLISELEKSDATIKVSMNNYFVNQYTPSLRLLEWDVNKMCIKLDSSPMFIDAITLLGHEIGHCYQDLVKHTLGKGADDEQENIEENEWAIAGERRNYKRKNHDEFLHVYHRTMPIFLEKKR